jgi:hypothetical protein
MSQTVTIMRTKPKVAPRKTVVAVIQPNNKTSKKRKRNRQGKPNTQSGNYRTENVYPMIQAPGTSSGKIEKFKMREAMKNFKGAQLTPQGMAFLKCAFAPPDFNSSDVKGFPDNFEGMSLVKKHRLVTPFNFNTASTDYYILLLPVPGYAFFVFSTAAGTPLTASATFVGVAYSDAALMFNSSGAGVGLSVADKVDKFRFVSNHIEIVPTVNAMQWTGSIQAWRMPVTLLMRNFILGAAGGSTSLFAIGGLQGCNSSNVNQYSGPFNLGVYTAAYNAGAQCDFNNIVENYTRIPAAGGPGDFGNLDCSSVGFTGLDAQFDSVCIKVSGMGTNVLNSCLIKTWACVEYQALANSDLYEYQTLSAKDDVAMNLYRQVIKSLPTGVAFVDNDSFWQRVLQIIRGSSKAAMALPGNAGMMAGGVYGLSSALEGLLF